MRNNIRGILIAEYHKYHKLSFIKFERLFLLPLMLLELVLVLSGCNISSAKTETYHETINQVDFTWYKYNEIYIIDMHNNMPSAAMIAFGDSLEDGIQTAEKSHLLINAEGNGLLQLYGAHDSYDIGVVTLSSTNHDVFKVSWHVVENDSGEPIIEINNNANQVIYGCNVILATDDCPPRVWERRVREDLKTGPTQIRPGGMRQILGDEEELVLDDSVRLYINGTEIQKL